jgi:putative tricarboxylic transport membrane protein
MSDRLTGAIFLLIAIWYGYTAQFYTQDFADPLGPSAFPQVLAAPFGLLSLYLLLRPDPDPEWGLGTRLARQAGAIVVLIVYSQVITLLGFMLSTTILGTLMAIFLGAKPVPALVTGVVLGVGFFFLFDGLFQLPLPSGEIFGG